MKPKAGDLLLIALVFSALAGLLALVYYLRGAGWLFWAAALLAAPNLLAFVYGAPFVPASMEAARAMLEAAKLKPGDKVYDIGCGDGRLVRLAADQGARAVGIELSPLVWLLARARALLWRSRAELRLGDFRWSDLSDADAVFCYINGEALGWLEAKLLRELKPGARAVLYVYPFPSWKHESAVPHAGNSIFVYRR